jgi:hypothetical protein
VTGISKASCGEDIISNAKPLLDSDDGDDDEDESVAIPKAVPQVASVNTQDMPNQDDDAEGQEVDETRRYCYALLRMRPLLNSWAECSVVISCGKVDYDKSG